MQHTGSAWVRRLALVAIVVLAGVGSGQALDVLAPEHADDGCSQSVLLPMASSRTGAVALLASFEPATPDRVLVTVALRYSRALFGVEPFLKAGSPNLVQAVLEMEGARMRFGPAGAGLEVEIVDLMYLPNTGTEYVVFAVPLGVFRSWAGTPQTTFGRIDTDRAYLEFDLAAGFFEAFAGGFVGACLGGSSTSGASAPSGSAASSYRIMTSVVVTIDVLRVRDAPGLGGNVVGRAERGASGDLLDVAHRDADGFRWWHVRFFNGLQGWVADGDDDLDYLLRSEEGTPLEPYAALPAFAPLAERLFEVAGVVSEACPEWRRWYPAVACGRGMASYAGSWASVASPMEAAIEDLLVAEGFTSYFEWNYGGGDDGPVLSAFFTDGVQVVAVEIGETNPVTLIVQQFYP